MDKKTKTEIEAAAFRTLRDHLIKRKDVQNIIFLRENKNVIRNQRAEK